MKPVFAYNKALLTIKKVIISENVIHYYPSSTS